MIVAIGTVLLPFKRFRHISASCFLAAFFVVFFPLLRGVVDTLFPAWLSIPFLILLVGVGIYSIFVFILGRDITNNIVAQFLSWGIYSLLIMPLKVAKWFMRLCFPKSRS